LIFTQQLCAQAPASTTSPAETRLPKGSPIRLVLLDEVSSATAVPGQKLRFAVAEDVAAGGQVVLPKGTAAAGIVTHVRKGIPGKQDGTLEIEAQSLQPVGGPRLKLRQYAPGEDACGDFGPCSAMIAAFVVLAPIELPALLILRLRQRAHPADHPKPPIAGNDSVMRPCLSRFAFTAKAIATSPSAAPQPDRATLAAFEALGECPLPTHPKRNQNPHPAPTPNQNPIPDQIPSPSPSPDPATTER
jgi:hypothetical protein